MKVRIFRDVLNMAGYPPKHRVWDLFPAGADAITVEASAYKRVNIGSKKVQTIRLPNNTVIYQAQAVVMEDDA